ncbi:MAG: histidine phosphatase family protein [Burkholderiaceae bacterium]|jgi:broad specificity phosphatase PhoE|nr:histidine phosphatase family protein [Burkholderiaceae bacterium]
MKRRTLLAAVPLAAIVPATRAARAEETAAWAALQAGGCAILLRHAQTEPGVGDPPGFRLDQCSTQRNLSAAGREQAQRFGAALRARGVRIDEVRSSRWCRCLDTARLAFPALAVQPFAPLDSFFDDRRTEPQQTAAVRRYLADLGSRNALLVTHQVNISALTGQFAAMGEAIVVGSVAADAAAVAGRIRVD